MARPPKEGLEYFPLYVDIFDNEIIDAISGEFGLLGEMTVIKLLCEIYKNGYFLEWNDLTRAKLARRLSGADLELLNKIIERLVAYGFFDKELFEAENVLTSETIQEIFFEATKRRKRDENMPFLVNVNNNPSKCNINPSKCNNMSAETPQSKSKSKSKSKSESESKSESKSESEREIKSKNESVCSNDPQSEDIIYSLGNEQLTHTQYNSLLKEFDKETVNAIIDRIINKPYYGCLNVDRIRSWCAEAKKYKQTYKPIKVNAFSDYSNKHDYNMDAISDMILQEVVLKGG